MVWTLLSMVLCLGSMLASQSHQESQAAAMTHTQDLRALNSETARAQSLALTSLLDLQVGNQDSHWPDYQDCATSVESLLLTSAASQIPSSDFTTVVSSLTQWRDGLTIAHHDAASSGLVSGALDSIQTYYTAVSAAISAQISATEDQISSDTPYIALGIVASVLGALGFVVVSVLTARRSHRVINIGLTIGLLSIVGAIVCSGIYAARSAEISDTDSRVANLAQAQADVWDMRSSDALFVLDPGSSATHRNTSGDLMDSIGSELASVAAGSDVSDLQDAQDTLQTSQDPGGWSTAVLNDSMWDDIGDWLDSAISLDTLDSASMVVPALSYVVIVAGCCVVAVIATLAGIHARTKEYL